MLRDTIVTLMVRRIYSSTLISSVTANCTLGATGTHHLNSSGSSCEDQRVTETRRHSTRKEHIASRVWPFRTSPCAGDTLPSRARTRLVRLLGATSAILRSSQYAGAKSSLHALMKRNPRRNRRLRFVSYEEQPLEKDPSNQDRCALHTRYSYLRAPAVTHPPPVERRALGC